MIDAENKSLTCRAHRKFKMSVKSVKALRFIKMEKTKILVIHIKKDEIPIILDKVRKLNAKSGPFDSVFLLGDMDLQRDQISSLPDLPPIITLSESAIGPSEDQQLTILSKNCISRLKSGLRVGCLALHDNEMDGTSFDDTFNEPVDILITREWSSAIAGKYSNQRGNTRIDEVIKKCHPRYHFAHGDKNTFFELEPFCWPDDHRVTRFINLASYGSNSKWAYAFNINIYNHESLSGGLIENPFIDNQRPNKHLREDTEPNVSVKKTTAEMKKILPTACHFCFTNPDIEDHMVVSIASKSYITTAKGPLTVPTGSMDFSGHCLLIPIEHIPKPYKEENNLTQDELQDELLKYENSIVKMNYRRFRMSSIVFEIHSDGMVHFHKQLVPVPSYLVGKFRDALDRQAHINNEKFTRNRKLKFDCYNSQEDAKFKNIVQDPRSNYMMFTVYETPELPGQIFLGQFGPNDRIDLQFGRRTLAYLLRLPNRTNWRSRMCIQDKKEEEVEVEKFQKAYKDYDIAKAVD